jgi:hypothetical protein
MNERTIRDLQEQREAVKKEMDDLVRQRNALESKIENRQEHLRSFDAVILHMQETLEKEERESVPAKLMRNEMVEIFREEGRPLSLNEMHTRLVGRGVQINGQDQVKNVGSHLSLDDRFERYGSGIWGLKSWRGNPPRGMRLGSSSGEKSPPDEIASVRVFGAPDGVQAHNLEDYLKRRERGA